MAIAGVAGNSITKSLSAVARSKLILPCSHSPGSLGMNLPYQSLPLTDRTSIRDCGLQIKVKKAVGVVTRAIRSSAGVYTGEPRDDELGLAGQGVYEETKRPKKKSRFVAGVDQSMLVDPWLLADPDSRFAEFYDVQIHYKNARPRDDGLEGISEDKLRVPGILLHGFGASLFSWERIMPRLAEWLGESVLAFDRPGFGLTSRAFPPPTAKEAKWKFGNPYSVAFSAAAALSFINFIQADHAILIGHSAGSIMAAEAYFQAPEKVAALILVAPALMAPLIMRQIKQAKDLAEKEHKLEEEMAAKESSPLSKVWAALVWCFAKVVDFVRRVKNFLLLKFIGLVGFILRSPPGLWLVRRIMDKGGPFAVRTAFFDATKADKYVLDGYTKPLGCRDWDRALVEFFLALADNSEQLLFGKRKLQEISCPVLVVTGDTDRIVPAWNSERLAKLLPCAEFKLIKNCGHVPQEETPEELVEIIKDFLTRNLMGEVNKGPALGQEAMV